MLGKIQYIASERVGAPPSATSRIVTIPGSGAAAIKLGNKPPDGDKDDPMDQYVSKMRKSLQDELTKRYELASMMAKKMQWFIQKSKFNYNDYPTASDTNTNTNTNTNK